ncbi:MAG: hypothetical protein FLDDKLPJ_01191 [Phycisphaerae bacterium]|nr:hypothetical protein [Phycisphaerae bacterium]
MIVAPHTTSPTRLGAGRAWMLAFVVSGALYALTAAPGVLWGDSGEIQLYLLLEDWLVGGNLCRSHPTYYAAARFFAAVLPFSPARCANLTAAFFGAVTVANAAWLLRTWCRHGAAAACGVTVLALSHTFWQMCTNAEVLTTYTALLTLEWICVMRLVRTSKASWAAAAALCSGLGWATHNMSMLSLPAYFVLAWRMRRAIRSWGFARLAGIAAAWAAGFAPLVAVAAGNLEAFDGAGELVRSWLIGGYGPRVYNVSGVPRLLAMSAGFLVLNFPGPLLLLAGPGLRAAHKRIGANVCAFLAAAVGMLTLFAVRYNVADQYTFLIGVYVAVALAIGCGVDAHLDRARLSADPRAMRRRGRICAALAFVSPLVYAALPSGIRAVAPGFQPVRAVACRDPLAWVLHPWRAGYESPQRFVEDAFAVLPHGAALIADTQVFGPVNYTQIAEGRRLDVRIIQRIARQPWLAPVTDPDTLIRAHLEAGTLYAAFPAAPYVPKWLADQATFEPVGPLFKAVPGKQGS